MLSTLRNKHPEVPARILNFETKQHQKTINIVFE